jgi:hypothetical protein
MQAVHLNFPKVDHGQVLQQPAARTLVLQAQGRHRADARQTQGGLWLRR